MPHSREEVITQQFNNEIAETSLNAQIQRFTENSLI